MFNNFLHNQRLNVLENWPNLKPKCQKTYLLMNFKDRLWSGYSSNCCSESVTRSVMNGTTIFVKSLFQNSRFYVVSQNPPALGLGAAETPSTSNSTKRVNLPSLNQPWPLKYEIFKMLCKDYLIQSTYLEQIGPPTKKYWKRFEKNENYVGKTKMKIPKYTEKSPQ